VLALTVAERVLTLATDHRRSGRGADAEFLLRELLGVEPGNVDALYELATLRHAAGDHLEAENLLRAALWQAPHDTRLAGAMADVRQALGRREFGDRTLSRRAYARLVLPRLSALAQRPRVWKYRALSTCERVTGRPVAHQPVLFAGYGEVILGDRVQFGWPSSPLFYTGYCYVEAALPGARIELGDRSEFNNNLMLKSEGPGIRIGRDGLFGAHVEVFDSNFHALDPADRHGGTPAMAPVDIGANVFVGMGVRILKGVTIGDNAVIGAGAVVTASIPADVIAAGNPARVVRAL
jgi:acetyltransferase-like isoleucine patch superfamily enzyme